MSYSDLKRVSNLQIYTILKLTARQWKKHLRVSNLQIYTILKLPCWSAAFDYWVSNLQIYTILKLTYDEYVAIYGSK